MLPCLFRTTFERTEIVIDPVSRGWILGSHANINIQTLLEGLLQRGSLPRSAEGVPLCLPHAAQNHYSWEGFKASLFQTLPRGMDNMSQVGGEVSSPARPERNVSPRGTASTDQLPLC